MARTKEINSSGKQMLLLWKNISFFLPSNMAAAQTLYSHSGSKLTLREFRRNFPYQPNFILHSATLSPDPPELLPTGRPRQRRQVQSPDRQQLRQPAVAERRRRRHRNPGRRIQVSWQMYGNTYLMSLPLVTVRPHCQLKHRPTRARFHLDKFFLIRFIC